MSVSLNEDTQRLIEEWVRRRGYSSPDEAVRAAFDSLREVEAEAMPEEVLAAIDEAEAQIARGEARDWREVREELLARYARK